MSPINFHGVAHEDILTTQSRRTETSEAELSIKTASKETKI